MKYSVHDVLVSENIIQKDGENELVSVIIPVYNRESTIKRSIDSVLYQTYTNWELIIVDDGSTDNTVEMVREYVDPRIKLICQKQNGGANKARNIGIANAAGEYIAFQDSDDEWMPDKLQLQMEYMKSHDAIACYCAFYNHVGNKVSTIPLACENKEKYEKNLRQTLREGNCVSTQTIVIHKSVLERMEEPGFDEKLPRLQDYDFAIRLVEVTPIAYISVPLVHVYRSADSISQNTDFLYQALYMLLEKHVNFLDEKAWFSTTLDIRTFRDDPDRVLADLGHMQQSIGEERLNCKDELIMYMLKQVRRQHQLLTKQYLNVVEHIENKAFAIYGAGKIGKEIYCRFLERGVRPYCFLVTEKNMETYINGIPVYPLDEYHDKQRMIVIGVGEESQNELVDNLIQRGFLSFCIYQRDR